MKNANKFYAVPPYPLMNVLLLEGGSLKDELYKLFGYNLDTPTVSPLIQAGDKIKPDAFYTLFNLFNGRTRSLSYIMDTVF